MSFESKKESELKEASFFVSRFNAKYSTDYEAISNEEENHRYEWVDVFAISKSQQYPNLNLQLETRDAKLKQEMGRLKSEARRTKKGFASGYPITLDVFQWVQEAIQRKKYDREVKKSLVLLITSEIGPLDIGSAKEALQTLKYDSYKGIYYVRLPDLPTQASNPHNGQIIIIKDIYNSSGERSF